MRVWIYILLFTLVIGGFILLLTMISNLMIAIAARRYSEKTRSDGLAAFEALLPGKNCGKCGCETCAKYAQAVFALEKDTDLCPEGGSDLQNKLDAQMEAFQKLLENNTPRREDSGLDT